MKQSDMLLQRIVHVEEFERLQSTLQKKIPSSYYLQNLYGDSLSCYAVALAQKNKIQTLVFIAENEEKALYVFSIIEKYLPTHAVHYFPTSYAHQKFLHYHTGNHVLRTEGIQAILSQQPCVLISYPQALAEKIVSPTRLQEQKLTITKNEKIKTQELFERLYNLNFEQVDFVYEAGQYAVRGFIIDVFSFGNTMPYRLELKGSLVESIRIFNPETQLSETAVSQFSISTNVNELIDEKSLVPFFDALPQDTLLVLENNEHWTNDFTLLQQKIEAAIGNAKQDIDEDKKTNRIHLLEKEELIANCNKFTSIIQTKRHEKAYEFDTKPQPAYNRDYKLLSQDLSAYQEKGFTIFIAAQHEKQFVRVQSIVHQYFSNLEFHFLDLPLHEGFVDIQAKIVCYTDHQIFQRYHKFQEKKTYSQDKILSIQSLQNLQTGDYLTHIDYGVGRFSGLQKITVNGVQQESVRMIYKDNDVLFVNINALYKLSKYQSKDGGTPTIHKIGSDVWASIKQKTKKKIKELAFDLIQVYAKRKANKGFAFSPDNFMQHELEFSFLYEDTPDQIKVNADIKKDMESPSPMDRLICGDVGFGKTELAIRAAFKACSDNKQVAVLVPTTVLAFQHYKTFSERLQNFPITLNVVNRFKSTAEKKMIYDELREGKLNIIIGTHALLNKKVEFKDLGLMIIDEEQKFGVGAKDLLKINYSHVDCLTLSATPIPRTLQFSLMGARDLSTITTPPPNRQAVETVVHGFQIDFIKDKIEHEVERGGQVFFVHNRVQNLLEMKGLLQQACPALSIAHAHGQMEGKELETTLLDFIDKKYDVLLSTNIIESGLDITNVNTILINNAHEFGLSDLHQLRGRVGRNNLKAHCFLLVPSLHLLSVESKKKLRIIEEFSDLGSGFHIAMKDLDRRGAGNILGAEQSGFINEIGLDAYQKILNEAMRELKQQDFKELFADSIQNLAFVEDCIVETDLEIFIPDTYIQQAPERLQYYTKINDAKNDETLLQIQQSLQDRFGILPQQVNDLFLIMKCRKLGIQLGFEKLILKNKELKCFLISDGNSPFYEGKIFQKILTYIQEGTNKISIKQNFKGVILTIQQVSTIGDFFCELTKMKQFVNAPEVKPLAD